MPIKREQCSGCVDNFYNGNNPLGVTRCWHAKDGKMVTRYRIGTWTRPDTKYAFTQMRVPSCYREKGYSFYTALPNFVKREDVIGMSRKRKAAPTSETPKDRG